MAFWLRHNAKRQGLTKKAVSTVDMDLNEILSQSTSVVSASVPKVSSDGRRIIHGSTTVLPPSPTKRRRENQEVLDDTNILATSDGDQTSLDIDDAAFLADPDLDCVDSNAKKKRYASSDDPLKEWLAVRHEYLHEFLRLEAPDLEHLKICVSCGSNIEDSLPYRCLECLFDRSVCRNCLVMTHQTHPLHVVERWNGKYFSKSSLRDAGLKVQLGHSLGETCALPRIFDNFVVLHTNGIHRVCVQMCTCDKAPTHGHPRQQLLRRRWYPATFDQPQTCATFSLLKHFQMQTLQAKTISYDYYAALEKLTDNSGLQNVPNRYKEFIRMYREYSHLISLKRGGRAHDQAGIDATKSGELAVRCPACPDPLVNLPLNWRMQVEKGFIYTLYIALDACFRLKRRMISSTEKRKRILGSVWVGRTSWRVMPSPNGVADLQVGERYANMDYCFASALRHRSPLLKLLVSYDIACQWSKHAIERLKTLPPPCVGQTDGEGVERPWANIGPMATSTRVMGPGARMEILDAHWGHWNWQKLVGLGALLSRRLRLALSEREIQDASFKIFSSRQVERVEQWKKMVEAYENDCTCPNPYEIPNEGLSEQDIRLILSREDSADAAKHPTRTSTPLTFISEGLDLMDQQQRIKDILLDKTLTVVQETNITEMRTRLTRSLAHFRTLQAVYIPAAMSTLEERVVPEDEEVESVPIILPSSLPPESRSSCLPQLFQIEQKLHEGRCTTALNALRNLLFIKSRLLNYKDRHVRHQGPNTRTRTLINRNETKIKVQVAKFQQSWLALKQLVGNESELPWPALTKADVRCMADPDTSNRRQVRLARASERRRPDTIEAVVHDHSTDTHDDDNSDDDDDDPVDNDPMETEEVVARESRREVSWIWCYSSGKQSSDAMEQALRVEWAKSWARSRRWTEEVSLLKEEMRRTLVSLRALADSWKSKATAPAPHPEYQSGLAAYAHSQAELRYLLANSFERQWLSGGRQHSDDDATDT
ncbi:hypothetical protein ONZ45_g15279 [Pleurotus djamor]|nr:hypothetical protein ONZ45_g15279 [Pleurotus djamor]